MRGIYPDSINEPTPLFKMEHSREGLTSPNGIFYPGRWGVIDYSGNIQLPFEYDSIFRAGHFKPGIMQVIQNGKRGLLNQQMEWVLPLDYQDIKVHSHIPLIEIRKKYNPNKPYYIDLNGTTILSDKNRVYYFDGNSKDKEYVDFIFWKNRKFYRIEYDWDLKCLVWYRQN